MRIIILISFVFIISVSCSYSDEEKKQAKNLYDGVFTSVSTIVQSDSAFASCLQFLMREMQKPLLKRDKKAKQQVEDSAKILMYRYDSLSISINYAHKFLDTANVFDEELNILASATSLCEAYDLVLAQEYMRITEKIESFDFPVNDTEYTDILELTFSADSLLNIKVSELNELMKQFAEKYDIEFDKEH